MNTFESIKQSPDGEENYTRAVQQLKMTALRDHSTQYVLSPPTERLIKDFPHLQEAKPPVLRDRFVSIGVINDMRDLQMNDPGLCLV